MLRAIKVARYKIQRGTTGMPGHRTYVSKTAATKSHVQDVKPKDASKTCLPSQGRSCYYRLLFRMRRRFVVDGGQVGTSRA